MTDPDSGIFDFIRNNYNLLSDSVKMRNLRAVCGTAEKGTELRAFPHYCGQLAGLLLPMQYINNS